MSDKSYRILEPGEIAKYIDKSWYDTEVKQVSHAGFLLYLVPENRLTKELDKKAFYQSKLQELINEFDFDRVHQVMDVLDWHWANVYGIPEKIDMISVVRSLYSDIEERVLDEEYCYSATGGFKLTFNPEEENELNLVFEAENYSVYGD